MDDVAPAPQLIAYQISPEPPIRIVPAQRSRDWMDATHHRFANRCLPLMIANQSGWWLLNSHAFTLEWSGGAALDALAVRYPPSDGPWPAESHFGHGILTFRIPFLFRTSPGWVLLAKGPANLPKPGIVPLEGVTETDWAVQTFTMNWLVTAPHTSIRFDAGEPFCQLLPMRRGDLEAIEPAIRPLDSDPELAAHYRAWADGRQRFNAELKQPGSQAVRDGWQKDYVRGRSPTGVTAPERSHQTNLKLRPFAE